LQAALARPEAPASVAKFFTPSEMRSGALLLRSDGDRFVEAPLVGTDVDLSVSGPTARARVTQMFHNPTDGWVEAVYVYPLPPGAAVDTLKMVIGERVVIGEIKDRAAARAAYEQAKADGQKASLIEQAPEHFYQLGREYRPARDRGGADRISGACAPDRRPVLAARAAGGGATP
jgi:Ca-activated chloride channel homolog